MSLGPWGDGIVTEAVGVTEVVSWPGGWRVDLEEGMKRGPLTRWGRIWWVGVDAGEGGELVLTFWWDSEILKKRKLAKIYRKRYTSAYCI